MKRTILYNNKDVELVEEDGEYVLVKHNPNVKVITRTSKSDTKVLQSKNISASPSTSSSISSTKNSKPERRPRFPSKSSSTSLLLSENWSGTDLSNSPFQSTSSSPSSAKIPYSRLT